MLPCPDRPISSQSALRYQWMEQSLFRLQRLGRLCCRKSQLTLLRLEGWYFSPPEVDCFLFVASDIMIAIGGTTSKFSKIGRGRNCLLGG